MNPTAGGLLIESAMTSAVWPLSDRPTATSRTRPWFLELNGGLVALMPGQIGFAAHIDGMQSGHEGTAAGGTLCPQVIGSGGLKSFNGLGRIVVAERELGVNRWQVVELDHRILWEALGQISR